MAKGAPVVDRLALPFLFAPFFALVLIYGSALLGVMTGLCDPGPSNTFAAFGVIATAIGLLLGVAGVLIGLWRRRFLIVVLAAVTYAPLAVLSLLLSGM